MWSEGRRSSALDRAEALLSARRNRGGDAESTARPAVKTARSIGAVRGPLKTRPVPRHTHDFLSDLSELSSSNSAADHVAGVLESPANMIQGLDGESFKIKSKKSVSVSSTPRLAAVHPSVSCSSPSNLLTSARAHLSPLVFSPSPSPPCVSSVPPLGSLSRAGSPHSSLSSRLDHNEALSLDELFVAGPGSEDSCNETSLSASEDFRINILTLDDLGPVTARITDETQTEEEFQNSKHRASDPASLDGHQQLCGLKKVEEEQQEDEEEDVLDYQSDFESQSRTKTDYKASHVLKSHAGNTEEEEDVSEVIEEAQESHGKTEDDYSSRFSDISCSSATRTSNRSPTLSGSRIRGSTPSASQASLSSCSPPRVVQRKEAAVQTRPGPPARFWSAGGPKLAPEVLQTYVDPRPVAPYANAETVDALRTHDPALFALDEMLRQQLALTSQFIRRSRHLHFCLVESLGHPDYKYTTLEETMQYIRKHRAPKLTMEEALEKVQQEMRLPLSVNTVSAKTI